MTRPATSWEGVEAPDAVDEALCRIYAAWCQAMEDGTAFNRLPDPLYQWRGHAPSVEEMGMLLMAIDTYMAAQVKDWAHSRGFLTGTHPHYLPEAQQWALLQELDQAIPEPPKEGAPPAPTPPETNTISPDPDMPADVWRNQEYC